MNTVVNIKMKKKQKIQQMSKIKCYEIILENFALVVQTRKN